MSGPVAGVFFAACIAIASYRLRWLTAGGAAAQFIMGSLIFGLGGWSWATPIIVFFLTSSILSVSFSSRKEDAATSSAKSGQRDSLQVIANGGVGTVLVLMMQYTGSESPYVAYVASCAAAAADTWATEVGTIFPGRPRMIIGFEKVDRGRSGGVSLIGTLASVIGSTTVSLSAIFWYESVDRWSIMAIIATCGLLGSLFDSILGATVQGQWLCPNCSKIVEKAQHCGRSATLVSGLRIVTNDIVNLVSVAAAAILAWCGFAVLLGAP